MGSLRLIIPLLLLGLTLPARAVEVPAVEPAVRTGARATRDAALIIGNESYAAFPQATYAVSDAHAFRDWLARTHGVSRYRTSYLENTDRAAILAQLKRLQWRVKRRGTMWIYFAGHGAVIDGHRVLLGANADVMDPAAQSIDLDELLYPFLRRKRARRVVVVLDAGFGNIGREGLELVPGAQAPPLDGFGELDDRVVIWAANQDSRPAEAFSMARHGLFTWTAIGALRGWADGELDGRPDGRVTLAEAEAYSLRAGRQVGRTVLPTHDTRPEQSQWVLAQGDHLEPGPDAATLSLIGKEDLQRRIAQAEARLKAESQAFWQDTLTLAQQGGEQGRQALQAYIDEFSHAQLSVTWAVNIPEVAEARHVLADYDDQGVQSDTIARVESCDDLVGLESAAILGQLREGQLACLEGRIQTERLQTTRSKVSRLLLVNAEVRGDTQEWERLMSRHLEDIDRSDPDLCMRYAIYLYKSGLDNTEEAIRWADYALENKQVWTPPDFTTKVNNLLRLRALAAQRLWLDAEQRYREEASPENDAMAREYRGWTMDYSREWLDYARASGKPSDKAFDLCASSAGTQDFCAERPAP